MAAVPRRGEWPTEIPGWSPLRVSGRGGREISLDLISQGLFDAARWSMNGTTVQAVSGDLDSHAQLQLRMMGSRESHDTNGILGCDWLRQKMIHPELTSSTTNTAAKGVAEAFSPEIIPNDKQKMFSDRKGT